MPYDGMTKEELAEEIEAMKVELQKRENAVAAEATKIEVDAVAVENPKASAVIEVIQDPTDGQYVTLKLSGLASKDAFEAAYWQEKKERLVESELAVESDQEGCIRMRKGRAMDLLKEIEAKLAEVSA